MEEGTSSDGSRTHVECRASATCNSSPRRVMPMQPDRNCSARALSSGICMHHVGERKGGRGSHGSGGDKGTDTARHRRHSGETRRDAAKKCEVVGRLGSHERERMLFDAAAQGSLSTNRVKDSRASRCSGY